MPHSGELWSMMSAGSSGLSVSPTGSPFTWTASKPGTVVISGGTVSLLEIGRGASWFAAGLVAGLVPVSVGDKLRLTYLVAPTVTFLAR